VHLTLITAVPKGERAEWLIEQASQLGVSAVQWLESDRSVDKPREGGGKMEKWRRLAIESAKQCHRTYLMEIRDAARLESLLPAALVAGTKILWLDPDPASQPATKLLAASSHTHITALIGPEGGWSPAEHVLLNDAQGKGQVQRVHLTPTVLRIETACAAIAAIVMSG
jgi:16S rRNA (uracil1498-N3)-methyltransferase